MANPPSTPKQSPLLSPPIPKTRGSLHKTLAGAASLANLLPTGTVLIFQALTPTLSQTGSCHTISKYLTIALIIICALTCFLSSFTDSFVGPTGKLFYGIATPNGLYVINAIRWEDDEQEIRREAKDMNKFSVKFIDFVHAFLSLVVFLVFAINDPYVFKCFLGNLEDNQWINTLILNLPLGVGALSSFLFVLFPTNRRGIGYADHKDSN
ncbi:unnamed protein product [Amaranthus hypochondriacus]